MDSPARLFAHDDSRIFNAEQRRSLGQRLSPGHWYRLCYGKSNGEYESFYQSSSAKENAPITSGHFQNNTLAVLFTKVIEHVHHFTHSLAAGFHECFLF